MSMMMHAGHGHGALQRNLGDLGAVSEPFRSRLADSDRYQRIGW